MATGRRFEGESLEQYHNRLHEEEKLERGRSKGFSTPLNIKQGAEPSTIPRRYRRDPKFMEQLRHMSKNLTENSEVNTGEEERVDR